MGYKVTYGKKVGSGEGCNALLDGRIFFTSRTSYPVAVFSTIKYEPKKEELLRFVTLLVTIYFLMMLRSTNTTSLKQSSLIACVRARMEISTLALAIIYFERLCLDCRVDKSNRRLSFAACLLLALKVNESNSIIVYDRRATKTDGSKTPSMTTWVNLTHDWDVWIP